MSNNNGFDSGDNATNVQTTTTNTAPAGGQAQSNVAGGILGGTTFFGNSSNNPTITRVIDALKTWCKEQGENRLEIVAIDGSLHGLRMSGIALAFPWASASKNENYYLVNFLLFEETLPERGNSFQTEVNGQQQQIVVTPDDWVTQDFLTKLEKVTLTGTKMSNHAVKTVGYNIINREISARPNETQVYIRLLQQAGEGFAQYIDYVLGEQARTNNTLKDILNNRTLNLNVDTSGIQTFNLMDQPVRSDFALTISAKEKNEGSANGLFDTGVIPLTQTLGFIDVTYFEQTEAERVNAQSGFGNINQVAQYQRFVATGVITDIQSLRGIWGIDSIVNAFLSLVSLTENKQWAVLLQRRFSNSSGARLRDVGALALEVDSAGGVIDTSSTQYNDLAHANLINAFFRPRFEFAIELPRQSAYGFLRNLLRGSLAVGSDAYVAFIKGLHEYTNGHFPLTFNAPIFKLDNRPVLMGSYGGMGGRHDLRDWEDYMTVLTQIGTTDINTVKEFDAAMAGVNGKSLEERTNTMLNIIERMAGDVVLTGKGDRYNINPQFLEVLVAASKAANLNIQTRTVGSMANVASNRRTADSMFGTTYSNPAQGSVFNTNSGSGLGNGAVGGGGLDFTFGV